MDWRLCGHTGDETFLHSGFQTSDFEDFKALWGRAALGRKEAGFELCSVLMGAGRRPDGGWAVREGFWGERHLHWPKGHEALSKRYECFRLIGKIELSWAVREG